MGNSQNNNDISTKNNNSSAKKPQKISTSKKTKSNVIAKARKKEAEKKSTKAVYNVKAKKPSATKKETKAPEVKNTKPITNPNVARQNNRINNPVNPPFNNISFNSETSLSVNILNLNASSISLPKYEILSDILITHPSQV